MGNERYGIFNSFLRENENGVNIVLGPLIFFSGSEIFNLGVMRLTLLSKSFVGQVVFVQWSPHILAVETGFTYERTSMDDKSFTYEPGFVSKSRFGCQDIWRPL